MNFSAMTLSLPASVTLAAIAMAAALTACSSGDDDPPDPPPVPKAAFSATIRMTPYGVPHVQAADFAGLGFGAATAYLRENLCLLADQVLTVNGERSKFHGAAGTAMVAFVPISNRQSDFFYRSYFDEDTLTMAYRETSADSRELLRGYIAGYNEFIDLSPGQERPALSCDGQPWVRKIAERDFMRLIADKSVLASGAAFARAIVDAQPPAATASGAPVSLSRPGPLDADVVLAQLNPYYTRGAASNAYAIGKDATANGAGMLLGNPHWPWFGANQFFQIHMTVPGRFDVFGVMNGDMPVPLIGFNKDIAWTHTVSPALRQSVYELTLTGDGRHYIVDGQQRELRAKDVAIEVRQPDGSITTEQRTLYSSHLGPVIEIDSPVPGGVNLSWTADTAYTLRDANLNSLRTHEQWMQIGQARNAAEVEQALRSVGAIPYVHTVAADREGGTLLADIGRTPNLPRAKVQPAPAGGCVRSTTAQIVLGLVNLPILDGSRTACDWTVEDKAPKPGLMPLERLPAVRRGDYVANSNQGAWFAHPLARIDDIEPVLGSAVTPMTLRQRLAFMQIEDRLNGRDGLSPARGFDSLDTMRELLFGNRLLAAELSLSGKGTDPLNADLIPLCLPAPGQQQNLVALADGRTVDIVPACGLLQQWDGRANLDSRGAVLFREFWRRLRMPAGTPLWLTPFDPADPVHTPRDLNTQAGTAADVLRRTLAETVADLGSKGVDFARPLGELQGVTRGGRRIALHGGDEFEGSFNKLTMRENNTTVPLTAAGYTAVNTGSSYVQAVTWEAGQVRAEGLLAYSQSSEPGSAHSADQTADLFAAKRFAPLPFSEAEIERLQVGTTERVVSRATKPQ